MAREDKQNIPPSLPTFISPSWSMTIRVVVAVLVIALFGIMVYAFRVVFTPLIIGSIMAYVLTPVIRAVRRVTRLPHGLATGLVFLFLLLLLIPVGIVGVPFLIEQTVNAQVQLINYVRELSTMGADTFEVLGFTFQVGDIVNEVAAAVVDVLRNAVSGTVGLVVNVARILLLTVFTVVIGFYITRDAEKIVTMLKGLVPEDYRGDASQLLEAIDGVWSAFFRGQLILSLTVTVILTVVSLILGLPQPLLLGIWGGLLEFLPSIGNIIWGATAILLAIIEGSTYLPLPPLVFVLVVLGVYIAFSQLDINILIPTIIGGEINLHPMVVIIGVIIGSSVGGVLGVALAAPTIATARIIGRYLYGKVLDIDPFPMIGPPAAPAEVRQEIIKESLEELNDSV